MPSSSIDSWAIVSSTANCTVVSGNTVNIVSAGPCELTASQAGNASYTPAAPVQLGVTIAKAPQTLSFEAQTPASHVYAKDKSFAITPVATSSHPDPARPIAIRAGYGAAGARVTANRLLSNVAISSAIEVRGQQDAIHL